MNKTLVCYFSASGITRRVAENIATAVNGSLFEIEPVEKYSDVDLDWTNKESRSSIEMQDDSSRPEVVRKIDNILEYDNIILGFPVWWYVAPRIVNTFIEENDLSEKDVYVFVTSGSSGYESSLKDLREKYPNINFISGIRLKKDSSLEDIKKWLKID